jgi:NADH dehydrogenase FAD-containing subunit
MLSAEAAGRQRFGKPEFSFKYTDRGKLVYAGKNVAVADLPALFGEGQHVIGDERFTYILWRAAYWCV